MMYRYQHYGVANAKSALLKTKSKSVYRFIHGAFKGESEIHVVAIGTRDEDVNSRPSLCFCLNTHFYEIFKL